MIAFLQLIVNIIKSIWINYKYLTIVLVLGLDFAAQLKFIEIPVLLRIPLDVATVLIIERLIQLL